MAGFHRSAMHCATPGIARGTSANGMSARRAAQKRSGSRERITPAGKTLSITLPTSRGWMRAGCRDIGSTQPNGQPGPLLAAVLDQPVEATFDAYLADQAIERLRSCAATWHEGAQPFSLGVHWFGPHLPYCIPREWFDRYDPGAIELPRSIAETFAAKPRVQANYAAYWGFDTLSLDTWRKLIAVYRGYVAMIDVQIQRVLDAVRELGLWESTAIIFTADHGEFTGSHRLNSKAPAMYDDIYRIPMIVRIPGAPAARVESRFASLLDLTPTVLELAGTPVPDHMDGRSLVPLVRGEPVTAWRDAIVAEFHGLHFPYPQRMLRTERHKLVVNPADVNELYDLRSDPDELLNRYDHPEMAGIRDQLLNRLHAELRRRGDSFHSWMAAMHEVDAGVPEGRALNL